MTIGDLTEVNNVFTMSPILGPILFLLYVMSQIFVMLSMLLKIIDISYEAVLEEIEEAENNPDTGGAGNFSRELRAWCERPGAGHSP